MVPAWWGATCRNRPCVDFYAEEDFHEVADDEGDGGDAQADGGHFQEPSREGDVLGDGDVGGEQEDHEDRTRDDQRPGRGACLSRESRGEQQGDSSGHFWMGTLGSQARIQGC